MKRILYCWLALTVAVVAGVREDWEKITALDAGPGVQPTTAEEGRQIALAHVAKQEKALRAFLGDYPQITNVFEARLRLARLLRLQADLREQPEPPEAARLVQEAERLAETDDQRREIAFAKVSVRMRETRSRRPDAAERAELLREVQRFVQAHPGDRRTGSLLAEIATLFDGDVQTKERLLKSAKARTKDPDVLAQIEDDFKRISWLGKALPLRFTNLSGRKVDVAEWRGKPVIVVFFATWSAPSRQIFAEQRALAERMEVGFVGVSLDTEAKTLVDFLGPGGAQVPVACDGKSWQSPLVQALGINALPSVWLLDRNGVVRTLDPLDAPEELVRKLMR